MDYRPGTHLLMDLHGARHLTDADALRDALTAAARAAGATVLGAHFHTFPDRAGITGVVLLAESHISIHTRPEIGFAAVDIFMCGACDPYKAVQIIKRAFTPAHIGLSENRRGLMP